VELYTNRGKRVFAPTTFEHLSFTNRSHGKGIPISISKIEELKRTTPRAYIHVLYPDGSKRFIQVRSLVVEK